MATPNLEEGSEGRKNLESAGTDYKKKFGSMISCMATSPHQPGTLSVGSNTILTRRYPHNFFMKVHITRSAERTQNVTSLSWHPEELLLAFGTDTGVVGIFSNMGTANAKDLIQKTLFHHKSTVYSVVWAPCSKYRAETKDDPEDSPKFFLYSCGGGSISINKNALVGLSHANLNTILGSKGQRFYTEICWKPDFSQFAVGAKNSSLCIYDGETFNLLFQICNDDAADVWCVRWHPCTLTDLSRSKLHDWIAVGFSKNVIHVYDLEIEALSEEAVPVVYESIRELSGHIHVINKLEWSPHTEGRLASCSKDCTVQIWNVISGETLVNFCLHQNSVLCVMWDDMDPDVVFSGDSYGNFHCWKPSNQVQSAPDFGKVRSSKRPYFPPNKQYYNSRQDKPMTCQQVAVPNGKDETKDKADMEAHNSRQRRGRGGQRRHRKNLDGVVTQTSLVFAHAENGGEPEKSSKEQKELGDSLVQPAGKEAEGMKITKTVPAHQHIIDFAMEKVLTWKRNNPEKFKRLLDLPRSEIPEDTFLSAFIGRMEDFYKFIDASNYNIFRPCSGNDSDRALAYRIILQNINMAMSRAVDFTPFSIGIARAVSERHWFDTCMRFARCNAGKRVHRLKMLTTLLSLKHFTTAFRNMKIDSYFMEANVIAKCFLPEDDPLIKECEQNMLNYFHWRRRCELTCFYYVCHGDILAAASMLNKRGTPMASQAAAYLCQKHGFIEEAKHYSLWGILKGFWSKNWDCMKEIVAEQPEMKDLRWVIAVYKSLTKILAAKKLTETHGICEANLFGHEESSEQFVLWKSYDLEGADYLSHLLKSLKDEDLLDFESPDFLQSFLSFKAFVHKIVKDNSLAYSDVKVHLALHICDFFIALHLKNAEEKFTSAFQSIGHAMMHCFDSGNFTTLNIIFLLCFPFDVLWKDEAIKIQLNVSCISENIIREAYEWLEVNISSRGLVNETGNYEFLQKKFNKASLREELLNISPADVIFTLFATNTAKMLFKSVKNNSPTKLIFDCHHTCKDCSFTSSENNASDLSSQKENVEVLLQGLEPEKNQLQIVEIESIGEQEGLLLQAEEPESVSLQAEESESVSLQAEEPEIVSSQAEEPEIVSSQAEEPEIVSSQAEEPEIVSTQAEEPEIVSTQAEEPEIVSSQAEELEGILPQTKEQEHVLPQTKEPESTLPQVEEPEVVSPQVEEPEVLSPQAEEPEVVLPQTEEPEVVLSQSEGPEVILSQTGKPEAVSSQAEEPKVALPQPEEPEYIFPQAKELKGVWTEADRPEVLTRGEGVSPQTIVPNVELKSDLTTKLEYVPSQTKEEEEYVPPQILLLGKIPSKTEVADEVQEHGSGSVTNVPKKDEEICDYCKVERVSNGLQHGCCLNRLRPLVSLMNIVTANTCKDIFKINGYWKTKDFSGEFNFWDFGSPTESNSDSDEFIGSVNDFIRSEDKLLDLLKMLDEKGQVNRIPNIESCACILENSVMEIINFCACPCLEIKLQSFVVNASRFLNN